MTTTIAGTNINVPATIHDSWSSSSLDQIRVLFDKNFGPTQTYSMYWISPEMFLDIPAWQPLSNYTWAYVITLENY
jgi:hypothetical protein